MPEEIIREDTSLIRPKDYQKFPHNYLDRPMSDIQLARLYALEACMRPGRISITGFLGREESLVEVMKKDDETLHLLGVSYEQIADRLEYFIDTKAPRPPDGWKSVRAASWLERRFGKNIYDPRNPQWQVEEHFVVAKDEFMGPISDCPWHDLTTEEAKEGKFIRRRNPQIKYRYRFIDVFVLNTTLGRILSYPGMAVHLIRDHSFFEGEGRPYRVDPIEAVYILEIPSNLSSEQLAKMMGEKSKRPRRGLPWNLKESDLEFYLGKEWDKLDSPVVGVVGAIDGGGEDVTSSDK